MRRALFESNDLGLLLVEESMYLDFGELMCCLISGSSCFVSNDGGRSG